MRCQTSLTLFNRPSHAVATIAFSIIDADQIPDFPGAPSDHSTTSSARGSSSGRKLRPNAPQRGLIEGGTIVPPLSVCPFALAPLACPDGLTAIGPVTAAAVAGSRPATGRRAGCQRLPFGTTLRLCFSESRTAPAPRSCRADCRPPGRQACPKDQSSPSVLG